MDLRRRNKQDVMETMDGKTPAPRAHEFACAHGNFHVDVMDQGRRRDQSGERLGRGQRGECGGSSSTRTANP